MVELGKERIGPVEEVVRGGGIEEKRESVWSKGWYEVLESRKEKIDHVKGTLWDEEAERSEYLIERKIKVSIELLRDQRI
ncbi:hypothetical protein [Bacillus sp. SG-1]|uniref:hypothetical protein n=1 Tax=Bacillus sp. SG-1 TaxID=161544 RepID=UPI0001544A56|nr:hypothetical protein [Bacillus sp. SG-1]EDL62506.1 hypothetical protein BSG1_06754 [Bacillus sp. SG-1]